MGSQLGKIYSGLLGKSLIVDNYCDISRTWHERNYFYKINLLNPRAPLRNKHLFAAANTEVTPIIGIMNGSGSQLKSTGKKAHITSSHIFQSSR